MSDSWIDENVLVWDAPPSNMISKHAGSEDRNDSGCRICGEEGHFARECPDKKPNTGECYNCGEVGHNKADCPNPRVERGLTGACFNCGEVGHNKADCPNPRVERGLTGACFNCGEVGHNKADCTNPRVEREFTGTCHVCQGEGHRAAVCPNKPPTTCKICGSPGHTEKECEVNRVHAGFASLSLDELTSEQAWAALKQADIEKDLDDFKKAFFAFSKLRTEVTLQELEKMLREDKANTYLIAKEQELLNNYTVVNLQGSPGQKFVVSFQFTARPLRKKFANAWPKTIEENMERLAQAGFVLDAMVTKCFNCGELGHVTKDCQQEKTKVEFVMTCVLCDNTGHRARDCKEPRKKDQRACRICESLDHIAKDCPQRNGSDQKESEVQADEAGWDANKQDDTSGWGGEQQGDAKGWTADVATGGGW